MNALIDFYVGTEGMDERPNAHAAHAFSTWFARSAIIDHDTKLPLVAYHGTDQLFETFSPSPDGVYGPGSYFTKYNGDAGTYGKHVMAVFLSIQNPYVVDAGEARRAKRAEGGTKGWSARIRELGYDGIMTRDMEVIIAFEPDQIRLTRHCPPAHALQAPAHPDQAQGQLGVDATAPGDVEGESYRRKRRP
jgi:hypothetical protein